jgi:hypothetical protein
MNSHPKNYFSRTETHERCSSVRSMTLIIKIATAFLLLCAHVHPDVERGAPILAWYYDTLIYKSR